MDGIVEATGNPIVGIKHALRAIETGYHIIMVTPVRAAIKPIKPKGRQC